MLCETNRVGVDAAMASPTTTPTSAKHRILLGKEETEKQSQLYVQYPQLRGFSDDSLNAEVLEAIVVLALTAGKDRVLLLAPPAHSEWVLQEFEKVTDVIFSVCKTHPNPGRIAQGYGKLFEKVAIAGRVLQMDEPGHWVSFGFKKADPVPEWLSSRLLE